MNLAFKSSRYNFSTIHFEKSLELTSNTYFKVNPDMATNLLSI